MPGKSKRSVLRSHARPGGHGGCSKESSWRSNSAVAQGPARTGDEAVAAQFSDRLRGVGVAAATRDRILGAAEALFVRDGFARTSIRAIAADAGVSEATVYVTFAGQAALLDQAIIRAVADERLSAHRFSGSTYRSSTCRSLLALNPA
jgi:AcrR family transcriptional regulator